MNAFWRTLEYGARVLGVLLVVVGMGFAGCGGLAYLVGDLIDEPFPVHGWQWAIVLAPLLAGISLYVLSGLFKGLAEE